jgi:hypothetical protein
MSSIGMRHCSAENFWMDGATRLDEHRVKVFNTNVYNAVEKADALTLKLHGLRNLHHNAPNEVRNETRDNRTAL